MHKSSTTTSKFANARSSSPSPSTSSSSTTSSSIAVMSFGHVPSKQHATIFYESPSSSSSSSISPSPSVSTIPMSAVRPSSSCQSLSSAQTTPSSTSGCTTDDDSSPLNAIASTSSATDDQPYPKSYQHQKAVRCVDNDDDDDAYSLCSMDEYFGDCEADDVAFVRRPSFGVSSDELPVFRCQSISPASRSISPIDLQHDGNDRLCNFSMSPCGSDVDFDGDGDGDDENDEDGDESGAYAMGRHSAKLTTADEISLEEIHARLTSVNAAGNDDVDDDDDDDEGNAIAIGCPQTLHSKRLKLETIVEGVFLQTPPRRARGAWLVAQQSTGKFVEDQRRRRYAALKLPEASDTSDAMEETTAAAVANNESDARDNGLAEQNGAQSLDGFKVAYNVESIESQQVDDRMLDSFRTKLNMC